MTRLQFHRYVERPGAIVFIVFAMLWVYTFVWGDTLGGFDLSIRAFILGSAIGLIGALIFAPFHAGLLSGLMGPVKRVVSFCVASFFLGGVLFAASALSLNRFFPAQPVSVMSLTIVEVYKIRGGWSATFSDAAGAMYEHTFGNNFGPVPLGTKFRFKTQTGMLGYPYFHSYERVL